MLKDSAIAVVGGGTMGEAIIQIALDKHLFAPGQITASDIVAERCQDLAARYGIHVTTDNAAAVAQADVVILAVKPQALPAVLDVLRGKISPGAIVLSIVAGGRIATLVEGLQHAAIVRAMPNTPAQIGEGMTVWTATAETPQGQRDQVKAILRAMGKEVYVYKEEQVDMATAVMGSGPAYVFLFMEAMVDAAVYLGFSRPVAKQLVLQTVLGSVRFAAESGTHLAELRNMVTSPGGTTAEALYEMEKGSLRAVVLEGIRAAYLKSRSLGS
jgi:pyrroline-5-carboxylate reductase